MKGSLYDEIRRLNPQQKEAVLSPIDQPVMVVAGAGSGKTRVLTLRVAYLVKEIGVPENRILAVTFTNKAADEMRERLKGFVNVKRLNIGTFHSIALRIVNSEAGEHVVYDEEDTKAILERIIKQGSLPFRPKEIRLAISRYKNTGRLPRNLKPDVFLSVYEAYQKALSEARALDFDDILIRAVDLLKEEGIRERYSKRFFYVLVDEYQDTNPLQHDMIKLIAGSPDHRRVFVVGDEDQSIYAFRGADFKIFLNFERDFPNARLIKLETNYRSTPQILSLANRLIKHNANRREKTLKAASGSGPPPVYRRFFSDKDEANWIARTIKRENMRYGDVMVLYRMNYLSKAVEDAFIRHGIPYTLVGDVSFYQRKEVKDLVAFLRVAINPRDSVALERAVDVFEGIGKAAVRALTALLQEGHPREVAEEDLVSLGLKGKRLKASLRFLNLLKDLPELSPQGALVRVVEEADYMGYLERRFGDTYESRVKNVEQLLNMASEYRTIADFVNHLALLSSVDTKERGDSVALMTVHAAKGLERDTVFVIGLENGTFPHYRSLEEGNVEEERRLCYVAITRAKRRLFLSSAEKRGWKDGLDESPFLEEMGILEGKRGGVRMEKAKVREQGYRRGDYVRHPRYGIGRVLSMDADTITVLFASGKKTFLLRAADLKKL